MEVFHVRNDLNSGNVLHNKALAEWQMNQPQAAIQSLTLALQKKRKYFHSLTGISVSIKLTNQIISITDIDERYHTLQGIAIIYHALGEIHEEIEEYNDAHRSLADAYQVYTILTQQEEAHYDWRILYIQWPMC
jgi:tetratricopeptide (TPR) repeat protein